MVTDNQVKIIGYTDLPSRLPTQSSQLYGTNLVNLLKLLCKNKDGQIDINFDDVVLRGVTVIRDGEVTWPAPPIQVSAQPQQQAKAASAVKKEEEKPTDPRKKYGIMAAVGVLFLWLTSIALSFLTSPCSSWLVSWVTMWFGMLAMRYTLH